MMKGNRSGQGGTVEHEAIGARMALHSALTLTLQYIKLQQNWSLSVLHKPLCEDPKYSKKGRKPP
jgi:hypothetical protein